MKAAQYFLDLPVFHYEFRLIINFMMDDTEFMLMSKEAACFISLEDMKTLFFMILVDSRCENCSYLHLSSHTHWFPCMWNPGEVWSFWGRDWRRHEDWMSWRGEPVAEGRGSGAVGPVAPCWVWEAV